MKISLSFRKMPDTRAMFLHLKNVFLQCNDESMSRLDLISNTLCLTSSVVTRWFSLLLSLSANSLPAAMFQQTCLLSRATSQDTYAAVC
uniref:Uncharacterized protein n=1 Tax=Glossina pallidipes TaxID=7398 RepID=A0A1B0A985_GLOPL